MSYEEKLSAILEHYGLEKQITKFYEEIGELMIELSRFQLGKGNVGSIVEEVADVEVMLDQIAMALDITEAVAGDYCRKIDRQIRRIEESGKAENR